VPALPDVPTLSETGLTGYDATLWVAIMMPAGSPAAIVQRLNREIHALLAERGVQEALAAQAVQIDPSTPEAVTERIRRDIDKWRKLAAEAGIRGE
jgi:tripartite-type tricarboxylate transporter receptor subunit TctC